MTATTFIGDGSGLTGITASGTGVVIRNNDTTVGTAGTINFGDDLSVTPIVAGIVTVGIDTSQINLNKLNVNDVCPADATIVSLVLSVGNVAQATPVPVVFKY